MEGLLLHACVKLGEGGGVRPHAGVGHAEKKGGVGFPPV